MLCVLALLSAIAPLATDMYLPGLPVMAESLRTSAPSVQLTLTTFMAGLGIGQLVVGPLSDGLGRRRLLLAATVVTTIAAMVCALAPSVQTLIAARLFQGLSGGAAIVLARACIADRARGDNAARLFSIMMIIGGVAPVIAPLIGGALLGPVGWRGIFWVLAGAGFVMVLGVLTLVPETLPVEKRHGGGLAALARNLRYVVGNRVYLGYALTFIFGFGALFAYISASPFVVQNVLGLSPGQFSIVFAINASGMVIAAIANTRLLGTFRARQLLGFGVTVLLVGGAVLLIAATTIDAPSWWMLLVPLFVSVASLGFVMGNATALAQGEVTEASGTGSALLGAGQFGLAALVSPLVGVAGPATAVPMAVAIPLSGAVAMLALVLLTRRTHTA
ncbi:MULTISPECIES: multidrug effflux MFS transporter [Rhodococcus]|uniref:Multidrug effflux MFS transporter n=1 Tax=Rhodococcus oxybenzonivorans TaxID=1990687 RepID=A0AAE4UWM3_9NOCA|nr:MULTISPECIES: multidrug effflux MFS transporter [Rhodococcus]MDV7244825.1 multidrug effflux MFS transporter [Rhodococcus oxybenzonivorans]MDV7263624.1 multidrug effflux MFS transporter [Rhodococcus oxybenzonivorans]MDV7275676.1 multidrug effflux MFS transporter [Rhodococcus oxybenzonivorans]MDV7332453.1 multidrug effflux MFS transporter [Rhodococcus oxybenzonivorans]MDV7346249.1 multidrug effflux MFS transporter [Rhodococcus oxybenzonivorans]